MNWPGLKRRLRLQPYLIDPYRSISYREARRIWRKEGRPDVLELLEGARKKAGKTPEEWRALTGLHTKDTRVSHGTALRRWAIACVFVLLASAFLAFTAPGRAFAVQVYRTFTTIAENILNIRATEEPDTSDVEPSAAILKNEKLKLSSLDEAQSRLEGPLLYFTGEDFRLESIQIEDSATKGLVVSSKYTTQKETILLNQRWPLENQKAEINISFENAIHYAVNTSLGLVFDGAYTEKDHTYAGGSIQDKVLITVRISEVMELERVKHIIDQIKYY